MKIITAEERKARRQGVKALILGQAGVGKTSLLRTLEPTSTFFVDLEAGDLAVQDYQGASVEPRTWEDCRDLACFLSGPNPAMPANACYSQAHFDAIAQKFDALGSLDQITTYFIDSITVAGRLCFRWAEQQPEAVNERGKKDTRGAYGLHAREMISWLTHLQHARGKNVIFVGILEKVTDDFNVSTWQVQLEGAKTGREIPGIVDQIITMAKIDFGDGDPIRAFVCTDPNPWGFPAKDRAGRLEQIEQPHLGKLLAKLTSPAVNSAAA